MNKVGIKVAVALLALGVSTYSLADDALVGGLLGAGIGAAIGHGVSHRGGALVGGAIGAVAGSVIGSNYQNGYNRGYVNDGYYPQGYSNVQYVNPGYGYYPPRPVYYQPVYGQAYYPQPQVVVRPAPVYVQPVRYYSDFRAPRPGYGGYERVEFHGYDRDRGEGRYDGYGRDR